MPLQDPAGRLLREMNESGRIPSARRLGSHFAPAQAIGLVTRWWAKHITAVRFSKFLVVGAAGVLVNSVLLVLFYQVAHVPLVVASALAVEASIIHNYIWNDRWTFARTSWSSRRLVKFNAVGLAGLVIATAILWMLVTHLGIAYVLANLVGIGTATIWNFAINSYWTWA
jgi:dolichol-phosphate mannosyltransferase